MTHNELQTIADRFIFAALNNLTDAVIALTDDLCTAQDQCKDLTGLSWFEYLCQRDEALRPGKATISASEIDLLLAMPHGVRCNACGFVAPEACFRPGRGRSFQEHPEHRYCPRCHQSITWHGFLTTAVVLARNSHLNKTREEA